MNDPHQLLCPNNTYPYIDIAVAFFEKKTIFKEKLKKKKVWAVQMLRMTACVVDRSSVGPKLTKSISLVK